MNGLELLNNRATLLLQFIFTAAFAGIGPYTSAIVFRALRINLSNPLEHRRALIAFAGCCIVDAICLYHLVQFLWCCNKPALRTKPQTSGSTKKDAEKRRSNIQRLRISNPVSVVKNPPASSASEKALVNAKAAILGEQPAYDRSIAPSPSLQLFSFEDKADQTHTTVHETSVNSGAVCPPLPPTGARRGSDSTSPLSTSFDFEKQYPWLSQEFNGVRVSQDFESAPQIPPTRISQSELSHTRPSQKSNGFRSSENNNFVSSASVHSSQQHMLPAQPCPHPHSTNSPNFSPTPFHPSSLRNPVSQAQPPAPAHLSNPMDSTHSRNYSSPFPTSVPSTRLFSQSSILPTDNQTSMKPHTSFSSRPRNFSLPPSVSRPVSSSGPQTPTSVQESLLRQHNPQFPTPPISTMPAPSVGPSFLPSEDYGMNQTFPMIGTAISTPDVSRPSSVRSSNKQDWTTSS